MKKRNLVLILLVGFFMGNANAMEGTTKQMIDACMETGKTVKGVIVGPEAEHIRKQTKSNDPIFVSVSRIEELKNTRDVSCARYRVTYTQDNIIGKDGVSAKEPYSFGFDINMCADGLPNELPKGLLP